MVRCSLGYGGDFITLTTMKNNLRMLLLATGILFAVACSSKTESASETPVDSFRRVAPTADGRPSDGGVPSNPGSSPDSVAQSFDTDTTTQR